MERMIMPKTATAKAQLPVLVNWKCSHCGCPNSQSHVLEFEASSQSTLLANDEELKEKARANLKASMPGQIDKIVQGGYQKAHLKLACTACSHKELWAQYAEMPNWVFITFIVGLVLLVADTYLIHSEYIAGIGALVAFLPLIVMAILNKIKNVSLNKKIQAMPEENKPHFYLKDR